LWKLQCYAVGGVSGRTGGKVEGTQRWLDVWTGKIGGYNRYLCRDGRLSDGCLRCGWQVQVGRCGADKEIGKPELLPFSCKGPGDLNLH